jgi:hypothetical protein
MRKHALWDWVDISDARRSLNNARQQNPSARITPGISVSDAPFRFCAIGTGHVRNSCGWRSFHAINRPLPNSEISPAVHVPRFMSGGMPSQDRNYLL